MIANKIPDAKKKVLIIALLPNFSTTENPIKTPIKLDNTRPFVKSVAVSSVTYSRKILTL